jgi:hypothetical protein
MQRLPPPWRATLLRHGCWKLNEEPQVGSRELLLTSVVVQDVDKTGLS